MPSSPSKAASTSPTASRLLRTSQRTPPATSNPPRALLRAATHRPLAIEQARYTATAVELLASLTGRLPSELRRTLSRFELEAELGRALAQLARDAACTCLQAESDPPDGTDMYARAVRAHYGRLKAAYDAELDAEADKALSAL